MASREKLVELFREFPGIGPRQALRFVYFLLSRNPEYIRALTTSLLELKESMHMCKLCFRFFEKDAKRSDVCPICRDSGRDATILMVVARDVDLENVEKSSTYQGLYFVLGGVVPILEKNPEARVRIRELKNRVKKDLTKPANETLTEIILGMSLNPEGENTALFIQNELKSILENTKVKFTHLGRGLSTGTELEYSDPETLKNALENRR